MLRQWFKRFRLPLVVAAGILMLAPSGIGAAASAVCAGGESGNLFAVMPRPFSSEADSWALVQAAGGEVVGRSSVPGMVVVRTGNVEFRATAQSLGAMAVLDAGGPCGIAPA